MWASLLVGKAPYLSDSDGRLMAARSSHLIRPSCHVTRTQIAMSYTLPALTCPTLLCTVWCVMVCKHQDCGAPSRQIGGDLLGWGDLMGGLGPRLTSPETPPAFTAIPKPSSSM